MTSAMMTIIQTADWLKARDNYLILTHRRPDGDALGCAGALAIGLREIGKTAYVLFDPETTERYLRFVEPFSDMPSGFVPEHTITVDTASIEMLQDNAASFADKISLCIDHHPSNKLYAENTCLNGSRAACGEIIYDILMTLCGEISPFTAECLYTALSTDTGCFAFANTTANTLRTAALTIEAGAPHRELNRLLFRTRTKSRVKIEGMINAGLEIYFGGAAAIATVTSEMMSLAGAGENDMHDIAAIPGSIEGVLVGITIRELNNTGLCKVSVRTSPGVSANAICECFGGGGHPMAAGFIREADVMTIKKDIIEILRDFLPHGQQK